MTLHDDPITSLALTPRRQDAALAALPWAEDESRWQRQIVISLVIVSFALFLSIVFA